MQHRFGSTTFLITGGLLIWMADFVFVYVFVAIACARGFADVVILSWPLVPVVTSVASLAAAAFTFWLLLRGYREKQRAAADAPARFFGFVTFATSGFALVALALLALPPWMVSTCVIIS
jgi:hypothetical protein